MFSTFNSLSKPAISKPIPTPSSPKSRRNKPVASPLPLPSPFNPSPAVEMGREAEREHIYEECKSSQHGGCAYETHYPNNLVITSISHPKEVDKVQVRPSPGDAHGTW